MHAIGNSAEAQQGLKTIHNDLNFLYIKILGRIIVYDIVAKVSVTDD
jgi:hypothetical protein